MPAIDDKEKPSLNMTTLNFPRSQFDMFSAKNKGKLSSRKSSM